MHLNADFCGFSLRDRNGILSNFAAKFGRNFCRCVRQI
ncbi:hypothetical protein CAMRE0001_1109 [Campylobacter rectus RM3267]|uniref:Uncharacterized protein n=1 Tax=Campylobacter rectus RM3267 TaxID=553218 RepID=B9D5J9_CAMRE|nr:hypothetical protein CAMRE0001_1109 [Campylobacter rectus RM3267]